MMLASFHHSQTRRRTQLQANSRHGVYRALVEALERRRLLSFSPITSFPVGASPQAVVTGDFNNDGRLDLATANVDHNNVDDGTVSVLLGNADGSFQPALTSATGLFPISMAAGDFNADGKLDLATANWDGGGVGEYGSNAVNILLGMGDGTFAAPVVVSIPQTWAYPWSIATGDLNADGKLDLVVTSDDDGFGGYIDVLLGHGDGSFAAATTYGPYYGPQSGAQIFSPVLADFNADGKVDVAVAVWQTSSVQVLLGNGDGTLQEPSDFPTAAGSRAVTAGDFNADGKLDLAGANSSSVSMLLGKGDGTFQQAQSFAAGSGPNSPTASDVNGDGKLDLVVSNPGSFSSSGSVSVLLGNGAGSFAQPITTATGGFSTTSVAMADFNGDGRPDAAAANGGSDNVSVLLNDGVWGPPKTFVGPGGNGSGGNWTNASNWSPAGVPGASDQVSIAGKSVNLGGSATVAGLTLTGGATLAVAANGSRALRTSSLSISDNSKLNLNDNDLIIDYSGGASASPLGSWTGSGYSGVTGMIARGYNHSAWDGSGLVSTTAQARAGVTTLAPAEAASLLGITGNQTALWNGQTVDATTVIVKYTWAADLNLDGLVDGADYGVIDNYVQFPGTDGYMNGDFNYDGVIDGADYGLIDNTIQLQGPPL